MTDIKQTIIDGMRGQGVRVPAGVYVMPGDWVLISDTDLALIAERLLRIPGIAIAEVPEQPIAADPITFSDTCCGKCPFGTCYVDQMTGA